MIIGHIKIVYQIYKVFKVNKIQNQMKIIKKKNK